MKEEWRDVYFEQNGAIYDYRGLYQISNYGRLKSLDRYVARKKDKLFIKGKIKDTYINKRNSYCYCYLYKNSKYKCITTHRLVAIMFIENTKNKPCINHKDGNRQNNCVNNLEWCTYSENERHSYDELEKTLKNNKNSKVVLQYDLQGNLIKEWVSVREIQRCLNFSTSGISYCCTGKQETSYGYKWAYKDIA